MSKTKTRQECEIWGLTCRSGRYQVTTLSRELQKMLSRLQVFGLLYFSLARPLHLEKKPFLSSTLALPYLTAAGSKCVLEGHGLCSCPAPWERVCLGSRESCFPLLAVPEQLLFEPGRGEKAFCNATMSSIPAQRSQCRSTALAGSGAFSRSLISFWGCLSTFLTGASFKRSFRSGMGMCGRWKEETNEKKQLRNSKEMKKILCLSPLQMGQFHLKKKHLRNNFKILSQNRTSRHQSGEICL